jgi:hypothetical protein
MPDIPAIPDPLSTGGGNADLRPLEDVRLLNEDLASLVRRSLVKTSKPSEVRRQLRELSESWSQLTPLPRLPSLKDALTLHPVRIIPFEGEWCVACGEGHYAWPLEKAVAIKQACVLAKRMGCSQIAVCDEHDHEIEVLSATA